MSLLARTSRTNLSSSEELEDKERGRGRERDLGNFMVLMSHKGNLPGLPLERDKEMDIAPFVSVAQPDSCGHSLCQHSHPNSVSC